MAVRNVSKNPQPTSNQGNKYGVPGTPSPHPKKPGLYRSAMFALVALVALVILPSVGFAQTTRVQKSPDIRSVNFSYTVGAQTNQTYITVKPLDNFGNAIPYAVLDFYFSDSPAGGGITATASSGTAGTITGTLLQITAATPTVATSRVSMRVETGFDGTVQIGVLDSAKTGFYPCVVVAQGIVRPICGAQLVTANYK